MFCSFLLHFQVVYSHDPSNLNCQSAAGLEIKMAVTKHVPPAEVLSENKHIYLGVSHLECRRFIQSWLCIVEWA